MKRSNVDHNLSITGTSKFDNIPQAFKERDLSLGFRNIFILLVYSMLICGLSPEKVKKVPQTYSLVYTYLGF